jgi:SAM-dependent methyltransferase
MDATQFDLHADVEQRHWWFTGRRQIVRALIEKLAPPQQQKVVLDVGCGTGGNIASLADAYTSIGVDTSAYAIEHARRRFPNVEFHCTSSDQEVAEFVPRADVITLMDVIEHVPDDFALVSRVLSAARPGTHVVITVPADLALWSGHDEVFGHYRRYDRERLQVVWESLPVTCRLLSHFNARLYPVVNLIRRAKRKRQQQSGEHTTDLKIPAAPLNWMLHGIFAGESRRLVKLLEQPQREPYRHGVSLLAVLRREPGEIATRTRPADAPPDYYDPVRKEYGNSSQASAAAGASP